MPYQTVEAGFSPPTWHVVHNACDDAPNRIVVCLDGRNQRDHTRRYLIIRAPYRGHVNEFASERFRVRLDCLKSGQRWSTAYGASRSNRHRRPG